MTLEKYPTNIHDLLRSTIHFEIMEAIHNQNGSFSALAIVDELKTKGFDVNTNVVQKILRPLYLRKYLEVSEIRETKRRGRLSMRYRVL